MTAHRLIRPDFNQLVRVRRGCPAGFVFCWHDSHRICGIDCVALALRDPDLDNGFPEAWCQSSPTPFAIGFIDPASASDDIGELTAGTDLFIERDIAARYPEGARP